MRSDKRLKKKIDQEALLNELAQLNGSEFNSFMLRLFNDRAQNIQSADLMRQFRQSRFTKEADIDTIAFKKLELRCLEQAVAHGFQPLTLSPLAPLGTCSAIARVHQNNVVSATRNTEMASDITNVMALRVAKEHTGAGRDFPDLQFVATQRMVRSQSFDNPAYAAHFGILAMVSGGFDRGSFDFEISQLFRHIHFYHRLIRQEVGEAESHTVIMLKQENHRFNEFLEQRLAHEKFEIPTKLILEENPTQYYQHVQFKNFTNFKGEEINLADGGLVDWTQKLIPNKKHRLFISGMGIELVHKLFQ